MYAIGLVIFLGLMATEAVDSDYNAICQVRTDSSIIWAVGDSGKVRKYVLQGDSSTPALDPRFEEFTLGERYKLSDVFFWDSLWGWIVGFVYDGSSDDGEGIIWRTVNGGTNWNQMDCYNLPQTIHSDNIAFLRVKFFTRYHGFIRCEEGQWLWTNDGGYTWMLCSKLPWGEPSEEAP